MNWTLGYRAQNKQPLQIIEALILNPFFFFSYCMSSLFLLLIVLLFLDFGRQKPYRPQFQLG